uniref:Na(+)/H(+) antiporter NhaA n=1 Tax=Candidatus Kentrum sp. SD TaxID=2126332 RepID=A0A450YNE2_9GAMM|nr:MAG: sodium/proton antiporter, NhaA family (TC 2.A.33.1.1) [Candidatus Kentron sp. SD]VFK48196.1 MAG: sodium/proton antiporter, NhaA family (TC 2.A.33.1.1) [Candidatus Kentron sp. SD]
MKNRIVHTMQNPAASGILIFLAAVAAMLVENSSLNELYDGLLNIPAGVQFGALEIQKPLLLWINDGLMAVFFFTIGMELKREFLAGKLSQPGNAILPIIGAIGGIVAPAGIYALFNHGDPSALEGWAIPTATDIAFAVGVLALLGKRVPVELKLFLLTLAIIDDLAAIIIIAMFYTADLAISSLVVALGAIMILTALNLSGVRSIPLYVLVGTVLWVAVLKSGVHATLSGVIVAMAIPLKGRAGEPSPLYQLEHDLHYLVTLGILPLFAFANAGVPLAGISLESLLQPVPLGIALGLVLGKQLGVYSFVWLSVKTGLAKKSSDFSWAQLYGVALLCGIGFTMSLFIGSLAFEHSGSAVVSGAPDAGSARLGILVGSLISGILGYLVLLASCREPK